MNRSLLTTTIAALGLTFFAAAQTQAAGHPNNGASHQSGTANRQGAMSGRHGEIGHSFKANGRFEYGRHGFRSLSWTRYGWSDRYRTYCYWEPRYGWCFYEPTNAYYLPIAYYPEVYPQAILTEAPAIPVTPIVRQAPAVVQQTSVVVGAPVGPAVDLPTPPVGPAVAPAPRVVQQTKVAAGVP